MLYFLRSLVYLLFSIFPLALLGKSDPHPGLPPFILQLANHIHELHILLFFVVFIETRSHEAGLELMILLPQPPECWDYRCAPPDPAQILRFNQPQIKNIWEKLYLY
jgi:hypothetical protein